MPPSAHELEVFAFEQGFSLEYRAMVRELKPADPGGIDGSFEPAGPGA